MGGCGATAKAVLDTWERCDYDAVMAMLADGAEVKDHPRGTVIRDRNEVRAWFESWKLACPDAMAGARPTVESADGAVVEGVYRGTNTGPFGPFAATGRTVEVPFSIVMRFTPDGLVSEYAAYYDQYTLLQQLGHVPTG